MAISSSPPFRTSRRRRPGAPCAAHARVVPARLSDGGEETLRGGGRFLGARQASPVGDDAGRGVRLPYDVDPGSGCLALEVNANPCSDEEASLRLSRKELLVLV